MYKKCKNRENISYLDALLFSLTVFSSKIIIACTEYSEIKCKVYKGGGCGMNRNPVIPFVLIMVFGIGLMFFLSFKGLGDAEQIAKEQAGEGKTEEPANASAKPEDIYKQTCISCHGDAYQGGVGPALKGVGDRRSADEIKDIITNGKNTMPAGLVKEDQAEGMVKFLQGLK